jgi:PKD repeat protein
MGRNLFALAILVTVLASLFLTNCTSRDAHDAQLDALNISAQMDSLQPPQGVDPAVFQQLKDELARQLAARDKAASTAPIGADNAPANVRIVEEGLIDTYWVLRWEYRNTGDYDQSGTVGVTDITPLAIHFNHDPGTDSMDIVLHPSGVGKVGISDVTAIAMNFGTNVAGYWLSQATAEGGPWIDLGGKLIADLEMMDTGGWRDYGSDITPVSGDWYRATPYDSDGNRGQPSAAVLFNLGTAPSITDVQPQTGVSGATYTPVVTYSGDTATAASWDFGGGATPNTSTDLNPSVTLNAPDTYSASVTLVNLAGSDVYNFSLVVTPPAADWQYYKVVDVPMTGNYISFAFIDGLPAFAYVDGNDGKLHYVRTGIANPAYATDWVNMVTDQNGAHWYDGEISLAYDSYLTPVILAYETTAGSAMFVGSNVIAPETPADWETTVVRTTVDEAGSLTLAQGSMFATYKTPAGLHFAEATTYPPMDETSWPDIIMDSTAGAGSYSRLKYDERDTRFYILAYGQTSGQLFMSQCLYDDRTVPASWTTFNASGDITSSEGAFNDLTFDTYGISDNIFYIFYRDYGAYGVPMGVLAHEGATDDLGFIKGALDFADSQQVGRFCSTVLGNGLIACTYQDADSIGLVCIRQPYVPDTFPTSWTRDTVPDGSASPLTDTNVLFYNGNIIEIVYGREDGIYYASLPMT